MMRTRRLLVLLALGAFTLATQGCVSLHTYDELKKREEALIAAYKAADTVVGNLKQQIAERDQRYRELAKQVESARGRIQAANAAIEAERSQLQKQYETMLQELRAEGGGTFVINESTGGVVLENDIFFAPGKANLKQEALGALTALIAKLNEPKFAAARIEVAGHSDSDPITHSKWSDNYQLSAERARAVLQHFVGQGVSPDRIYLSGYGPTRPRADEKSENRRVEIVLHEAH